MVPPAVDPIEQILKTRVLSAVVLLPIVIAILYAGGLVFALFMALAAVLMALEWDQLTGSEGALGWNGVTLASGLILALTLSYFGRVEWAFLALFLIALFLALIGQILDRGIVWPVIGLFWLGLPSLALIWLRMSEQGMLVVSLLFLSVWSCDTGAYFAGRGIGGPKLAPRISPKKTWAGLFGGMLAAAGASGLLAVFAGFGSFVVFSLLGAVLALISQFGDLAESSVKRRFKVKDSGTLIPGHGGILDRVDGLLFASPALAILLLVHKMGHFPW